MRLPESTTSALSVLALANTLVPIISAVVLEERQTYRFPFNHLVAFGDELSDDGSGSYTHGISGSPADIYGFGTWTNGQVAVQYLASIFNGASLIDYAWGGCCGGNQFGATVDNTYTTSEARYKGRCVPSVHDQISNYTASSPSNINTTMAVIWTGQNDLTMHTNPFDASDPQNAAFAIEISQRIVAEAERLAEEGIMYILVANIYPKHRAPVTTTWLCPDGSCVDTLGNIILKANEAIEAGLQASEHASKFIYHDTYSLLLNVIDDADVYGFTQPLEYYCDGDVRDPNQKYQQCLSGSYVGEGASQFFWPSL